jgi:nitrous oxidase accessory protein
MLMLLMGTALAAEILVGLDAPTVQDAIDVARAGDVVVLPEGQWDGPAVLSKPVTLTSRGGSLVGTTGSTLRVEAPGAIVRGLKIVGSGSSLRGPDSCVYVSATAKGAQIKQSEFTDCLFGIWVQEADDVRVLDNRISGRVGVRPASKGNGIHLHNALRVEVRGNVVRDARDGIYVSATEDSVIASNEVSNQRFGIHYMYSLRNKIVDNIANGNSGGIALMQSRDLVVTGNTANDNKRHGILFRDVVDSVIENNAVARNGEGIFFFSSVRNRVVGNLVHSNDIGVRVWAGTIDNKIEDNNFINNREPVFYVASEDQVWGSNYWSDYLGWDQDNDGYGDRVYRNKTFMATLIHQYPQAVLLLSSPTVELLANLQARIPALRLPSVVDEAPHISPVSGGL